MFDQEDYYSDDDDNIYQPPKDLISSRVLSSSPNNNSDFNHLTGDGQNILKMMKERGIDLTDNEIKKLKVRQPSSDKAGKQAKGRSGFYDAGTSATTEELIKALNKALSKADPQQASAILTHILAKKTISVQDINKFGVMKCKILFGLGAYKDCEQKAQQLICKASDKLKAAIFSNYLAKCKALNGKVFEGYMDFLRAKTLITQVKAEDTKQQPSQQPPTSKPTQQATQQQSRLLTSFKDSQVDSVLRQIDYTELQYNIKLTETKNAIQVLYPHYSQFRHRKIKQVACGDFHALFLVEGAFDNCESSLREEWRSEVFGMGENGVGQVSGKASSQFYKQPILIPQLSGKCISGIYAFKQSSLAYNKIGQIYQWGVKQDRNDKVSLTYNIGEEIESVQRGNKHYALMAKSKKFYVWGQIEYRGAIVYKQSKPAVVQEANNIATFSCGNSCVVCVDSYGDAFALGNNQYNQTFIKGENFTKTFKKIPNNILGKIAKVFCIGDCTFFVNYDQQVYLSGKYTHNKQINNNLKQAEFAGEIRSVVNISGHIGCYYLTNESGEIYKWAVDENVKFRLYKDNSEISQRYVVENKGHLFRVKSPIEPQYCTIKQLTDNPQSYSEIKFQLQLKDRFGLYGLKEFIVSPKCQIHLSTYEMTSAEILKENKDFLDKYKLSTTDNRILLNQIVDPKICSYKIAKNHDEPWLYDLDIMVDTAGKYFFYVVLQQTLLYAKPLQISLSVKESEQSQKNLAEKKAKEQQRRRKIQMQKKRLLQEKMRKEQEEEQKVKQTQRRAEDALKKHLKDQQQMKNRQMEERKARKELQTGGGFDLTKLAKRNSNQIKAAQPKIQSKSQIPEKTTESFMKSSQSFLPDINTRPGSRRKLNIRKESIDAGKKVNPLQKTSDLSSTSKSFLESKIREMKDVGKIVSDAPKMREMGDLNKATLTNGKTLIKRGLSKAKK